MRLPFLEDGIVSLIQGLGKERRPPLCARPEFETCLTHLHPKTGRRRHCVSQSDYLKHLHHGKRNILICKPSKPTKYKKLPVVPAHTYILNSFIDEQRFLWWELAG